MVVYYVAKNGNDSGNGSAGSPWLTIGHAVRSGLKPGDEVIVKAGTYNEAVNINIGGSAAGYVTIRSEVPGAALIRPPSNTWTAINVNDDYVVIDGFDIGGANGSGIGSANVHHVTVRNNIIHDNDESGVQLNYGEFFTVENNIIHGNASSGWFSGISIYQARNISGDTTTQAPRIIIRGNESYDNITREGLHTDGNGIILDDFQNNQNGSNAGNYRFGALVENNLLHGNGGKGIAVHWSDNATIRNNTAYHNNMDPLLDGTWQGELSNQDSNNNIWANNIAVADPNFNNQNNTAIGFYGRNSNVTWANNITFNGRPGDASQRLDGGNPSLSAANGNLLGVDPRLTDPAAGNFNPRSDSPVIDSGTSRYGLPSSDLDGGSRIVGTVDMGAYEVGSGSDGPVTPPPLNTAPVAGDDGAYTTPFGTAITLQAQTLLANDSDANGDVLTITGVSGATGGAVRLNSAGSVVFTPGTNVSGPASFDYVVSDGKGGTDTAVVEVSIGAKPISNSPPVAADDDGLTTAVGTRLRFPAKDLLVNDRDPDGDTLTVTSVGNATGGTVWLTSLGDVVFTPASGFKGLAGFDYAVADGKGGTASASVSVTVGSAPVVDDVSFWSDAARPAVLSDPDTTGVELGLKFLVETAGMIEGLRFYKSAQNTGTHTGTLWDASGRVLATATFGPETSSGWQEVSFSTPVQVAAGQTLVASYHAPNGHYSVTEGYFSKPLDAGPITALANGGVYSYGARGSFPQGTYNASNYWVDVVFDPAETGTGTTGSSLEPATRIVGTSGNDSLIGTEFDDILEGRDGKDHLTGSHGHDILIGGRGGDRFIFTDNADSALGEARDVIRAGDGAAAIQGVGHLWGDRIDLSGIDADPSTSGRQVLVFDSAAPGGIQLEDIEENTLVRATDKEGRAFELLIEDGSIPASLYGEADFLL